VTLPKGFINHPR